MDGGTVTGIASVIVAGIAAFSSYASQRAAAKASTTNTATSSRVDMEKDAYERARAFDIATIERQDEELKEVRQSEAQHEREIRVLKEENAELRRQLRRAVLRISKLENPNNSVRRLEGEIYDGQES